MRIGANYDTGMKFHSKHDYSEAVAVAWTELWLLVDAQDEADLVCQVSLKPGTPARSAKDALAHVHAWHKLVLAWYAAGVKGTEPDLPSTGYNWSQTKALNVVLHDEYEAVELASVRRRLKLSHARVEKLVVGLTEKQLLEPGYMPWTGKLALMSYIAPNTVSHYRWAKKKIRKLLAKIHSA